MGLCGILRVVVIMHVCAFVVLEHCQYFSGLFKGCSALH